MKKILKFCAASFFYSCIFFSCTPIESGLNSLIPSNYMISDSSPLFCLDGEKNSFYEDKVLFVVDHSSSSKKSDPDKSIRAGGIKKFIKENQDSSYAFILFSKNISSPLALHGLSVFTKEKQKVEEALDSITQKKDEGRGNYEGLLDHISKTLEYDALQNVDTLIQYHILFISDGSLSISEKKKKSFVQGIKNLVSEVGSVQVHSVYYGNYQNSGPSFGERATKGAKWVFQAWSFSQGGFGLYGGEKEVPQEGETQDVSHLKHISENGGGVYIDSNKASWDINLDAPWQFKGPVIYNLNRGFCFDGYSGLDSDQDGLCDRDEKSTEGFDPLNRFSFGDGYSDVYHWFALKEQNMLPPCFDKEDKDHDLLTRCEESYINSIESPFPPLKNTDPDSDRDGIIDGIETRIFLTENPLSARDPDNLKLQRDSEGLTDKEKILQSLSPFIPEEDQESYGFKLIPVKGSRSSCYGLQGPESPFHDLDALEESEEKHPLLIYILGRRKSSKMGIYRFMHYDIDLYESSQERPLPLPASKFYTLRFKAS